MAGPIDSESESSITIYLREIGRVPLLTIQEEIELAAIIKKGVEAEKKLKELSKKTKIFAKKPLPKGKKVAAKTAPASDKDKAKKSRAPKNSPRRGPKPGNA
ncbi:sigma-70 factor domain-containing protein [Oscillatoria amoena NRMC-F 0135]|nr:sigma-70 factor domain-containing protein [Oscillatoria amoena NRMC-F 0135]